LSHSSRAHLYIIHTRAGGAPPHKIMLHTFKFLLHTLCSKTHYFRLWGELTPVLDRQVPPGNIIYKPGGRLPLLSARPAVTFPAVGHHSVTALRKVPDYAFFRETHR